MGGTVQESMFLSPVREEEIDLVISTIGDTAMILPQNRKNLLKKF